MAIKKEFECKNVYPPRILNPPQMKLFTVKFQQLNGCGDEFMRTSVQVMSTSPEQAMRKLDLHMKKVAEENPNDWQAKSARPASAAYETEVIK